MATGVKSWSTTAASNASADSTINWSEGMAPSLVNDSARAEMAAVAAWYAQIAGGTVVTGTVGGTANAITLTCSPTVDALATGQRYLFKYTSTGTTGAVTLQVDSTSAIALRYKDVALTSGDIATNDWVFCIYDGTRYQLINHPRVSWATTDMATDSTGGATGDFIPFLDASASNELNKVLTTDLMANMIANFTTKTTPVAADKLMIGDSAASGAAKISTIQQLFNSINGLTADTTPDGAADYIVTYDNSASAAKKVLFGRTLSAGVLSKTAGYTVVAADAGKLIRFSGLAGDVTLALPAAATCGDGFVITIANDETALGSNGVVVDPSGAELIDGQSTRRTGAGSRITIVCDGTGWRTVSGNWRFVSSAQTITTGGTLTLDHGLKVRPTLVKCYYKCTTIDLAYAVGDYLEVPIFFPEANMGGCSCIPDATNLNIRFGDIAGWIPRKDTGAAGSATASRWKTIYVAED